MSQSLRTVLFAIWLVLVSLVCLDIGLGWDSLFSRMFALAGLPFVSKRRYTASLSTRYVLVALATFVALAVLIVVGPSLGFTATSHFSWLDDPVFRAAAAFTVWVLLLTAGIRAFLAGRFLADRG